MKKWKVTFLLNGSNRAEEVLAHSNNEADRQDNLQ
jgi:hypothetical protein